MPHPDMNESWVNGHPDEGLLHEWLDEQLPAGDAAVIHAHVHACAECAARVAEARGLIAASRRILTALDDVPAHVIPAPSVIVAADATAARAASTRVPDKAPSYSSVGNQTTRAPFRWRTVGKVAAVVLIAIIPGVLLLRGDDVALPTALQKSLAVAESANAGPAADAASVGTQSTEAARAEAARAPGLQAPGAKERLADANRASPADAIAQRQVAPAPPEQSSVGSRAKSATSLAASASASTAANATAANATAANASARAPGTAASANATRPAASALASARDDSMQSMAQNRIASSLAVPPPAISAVVTSAVGTPPAATTAGWDSSGCDSAGCDTVCRNPCRRGG